MGELENAIEDLKRLFEKYGIRGQFVNQVNPFLKELPTNHELDFYFENFNPVNVKIDTGASPFKLIDGSDLYKAQLGYRWNANSGRSIDRWNSNDIVIGDDMGGGRPIIVRTNIKLNPVFASYEGVTPFEVADSLVNFFKALGLLIDLVYGDYNIFEINNDDESIKEEFTIEIKKRLIPVLGAENSGRLYDYFYG